MFRSAFRFGRFLARRPRYTRNLTSRPKAVFKRTYRTTRRKKIVNKVHRYLRWADKDTTYGTYGPNQIVETLLNQNLTYQFKLDNVVNPSDFVNLYDQYRINKITLYLEPLRSTTGEATNGPYNFKMSVVHDYNDASPLTQEDDYLEYSNCKRYNVVRNGAVRIILYPKINNVVENVGGVANAYTSMNSNKVWLNIAEDEVPHFGLKIFIPAGVTTEGYGLFRVRAKFDLSFKNSK